jgi:hypothetical protein
VSDGQTDVLSETESFTISSTKAKSPDRMITVDVLSPLPAGAYLDFEDAAVTQQGMLELARQRAQEDRLITLISYPAWNVRVTDINSVLITGLSPVIRLTMRMPDSAATSVRGYSEKDLKAARLDEASHSWRLVENQSNIQSAAAGSVAVVSSGFSVYSLVGAPSPDGLLSSLANFPNPFSAGTENTRIQYVLTADSDVTIHIYNLLGDLVNTLKFARGATGGQGSPSGWLNEVTWDGKNETGTVVANGMYLASIEADSGSSSDKKIRRIGVLK